MFGFNGDFRSRPNVSIRGASKKESKEDLVRRAKEERQKREDRRLQEKSAVRIQSFVRRFLAQRRWHKSLRVQFDAFKDAKEAKDKMGQVTEAVKRINFFFSVKVDKERLVYCHLT